jgi:hypothetical protein
MSASPEPVTKPRTSLVAGASWLLASKICSFAITAALPFILTRRLSQTEYGYYKQLFLILTTTLNLLPFGMNMSLFYFIPRAKTQAEKGNISLNVVIFYLVTTGVVGGSLIVNPALIEHLFHSAPLTMVGRLIGLTMIPYIVSSLLEIVLIANGDARLAAISGVAINTGRTILILIAASVWGTIDSILWSVLIVAILQFICLAAYMATQFGDFWTSFHWGRLWAQLVYALPLGLAGLTWALQVDVDNYFVNHYFSVSLAAKQVIILLFTERYIASVPIFRVNLLMVLLAIVAVDPVLRAFKSEYLWLLRTNVALLALLCVALYFGTTRFGLIGAVSCVIIVQYIARVLLVWRISRLLKLRLADLRPLKDVLKTLLVATIAGLCVEPLLLPIQRWGALATVLISGTIFCTVYLFGLIMLKVPSESEVDWFRSKTTGSLKTRLKSLGIG